MNTKNHLLSMDTPVEDRLAFFGGPSRRTPSFQVDEQISAAPRAMKTTGAKTLFVNCTSHSEIDALWENLTTQGVILMELANYPFSEKFGWVEDEFGVSWQLNLNADD